MPLLGSDFDSSAPADTSAAAQIGTVVRDVKTRIKAWATLIADLDTGVIKAAAIKAAVKVLPDTNGPTGTTLVSTGLTDPTWQDPASVGKAFGQIYANALSNPLVLTTINLWYLVINFATNGLNSNSTVDYANSRLVAAVAGTYQVYWSMSVSDSASHSIEIEATKNSVSIQPARSSTDTVIGSTFLSGKGFVNLAVSDVIELRIRCISASGITVTPKTYSLSMIRVA